MILISSQSWKTVTYMCGSDYLSRIWCLPASLTPSHSVFFPFIDCALARHPFLALEPTSLDCLLRPLFAFVELGTRPSISTCSTSAFFCTLGSSTSLDFTCGIQVENHGANWDQWGPERLSNSLKSYGEWQTISKMQDLYA